MVNGGYVLLGFSCKIWVTRPYHIAKIIYFQSAAFDSSRQLVEVLWNVASRCDR